jgi:hypothetical protein
VTGGAWNIALVGELDDRVKGLLYEALINFDNFFDWLIDSDELS